MIKFWKSSAKGKDGCLVRPPEIITNSLSKNISDIDNDFEDIFQKGSKLSFTLHKILVDKEYFNYFLEFMEDIDKDFIVKCWVELDHFHSMLIKTFDKNSCNNNNNLEMNFENPENSDQHRKDTYNLTSDLTQLNTSSYNVGMQSEETKSQMIEYALNLFKKYVALESPFQLKTPNSVRKEVITNICEPQGGINKDCFRPFLNYLFKEMEENYFNNFLKSCYCIKAQIDVLTKNTLKLKDIIYNETILFYFTEYIEQESCSHFLEFLISVINFRNHYTSDSCQSQKDAVVIYEKYLSLQAPVSLDIKSEIRIQVENEICREGGPLSTCFDKPFKIIYLKMSQYVKMFWQSNVYFKYLSEMIYSVKKSLNSQKTHSECSSEYSISSQNTLLASSNPEFHRKKCNIDVPDMTIDPNRLYNADSLWQRKKQDGLNIGRINSLGQFESKFEPDPDKKDKSVLKKMVNRLIPTRMVLSEEEIAWQVAQMIVKDVTDLTMAMPESDPD